MASCPRLRPPRSFCRRAVLLRSYDGAAGGLFLAAAAMTLHRFPSLGLKSRIIASPEPFLRVSLQRFSNSPPQIKNHCTNEGINGRNNAVIRKSEPEIKNRCSRRVVAVCRRNHSPLPLRKLESDADLVAATTTAGGPFFSAAKKIRIRRGDSLQKAAHPQTIPQHAFHHALPTRLALDVCMGTGSTQVRQCGISGC